MHEGQIFRHDILGECLIRNIIGNGKIIVTTTDVQSYRGSRMAKVFTLERPQENFASMWSITEIG